MKLQKPKSERYSMRSVQALGLGLILLLVWMHSALPVDSERSETDPAGWWWLHDATTSNIQEKIEEGFRIIDLEVEQASPLRMSVAMVRNQGSHGKSWWWYINATVGFINDKISEHGARIIDLESYEVSGEQRFAAALVANTGSQATSWWWYLNTSTDFIASKLSEHNARLIDLDTYFLGRDRFYSGVMISNQGSDAKSWWWYVNATPNFIASKLSEHQARLVDIERHSSSTFTVVMERSQGDLWWWYFDLSEQQVNNFAAQNGARLIDVETYTLGGQKRFAVIMLNNSNALTTQIGNLLRTSTDGIVGLYLKRVSGPVLASLQETKAFYPASTIKVLQHVHAMRAVAAGSVTLDTTVLRVYPAASDSCSNTHSGQNFITETLRTALQRMMGPSNNQSANAVQELFGNGSASAGRTAINRTAYNILDMSQSTALNHKFACGGPSNNPANQLTLADLGSLYELVATDLNVFNTAIRLAFYQLMLNETSDFFINSVIDQEAAALGLSSSKVQSFKAQVKMAQKAGNIPGAGNNNAYLSIGGWVQLPVSGGSSTRQFVYGIFIDNATVNTLNIRTVAGELLRDEIRSALNVF